MRGAWRIIMSIIVLCTSASCSAVDYSREACRKILLTQDIDSIAIDSIYAGLDSILSPEIFGRDFAMEAVAMLECDTIEVDASNLNHRISILRKVIAKRGIPKHSTMFAEGVQSYIDSLPIEQQMKLYTRIATPAQMGNALRIDRYSGVADSTIQAGVNALRLIYNEEEMNTFLKYYNR